MELESEQQLFEAIRKGNKEAFNTLAAPLIARAYRTSAAILRSPHLAEEAVQNALIESYTSIMNGKDIRNFRAWFNTLIAHRALDVVRQESRSKKSMDIEDVHIEDVSALPEEELLKKEQSSKLLEAVMSLELHQRVVLVLFYFQELKIEQIALLLGVKEGTVKSRLYHARNKLNQTIVQSQAYEKVVQFG